METRHALMLFLYGATSLAAGCAHTIVGERTTARFEAANSLLIVLERKNYFIERRPEGGFYENGINAQQRKLEQELKTTLVEHLRERGVSSEFMPIPAAFGPAREEALSWNSAIGKDKFPYVLLVIPGDGVLYCRSGGYDCSAAFTLEFRLSRRTDNLLLWKASMKSVGPSMLASTPYAPSILVKDLTEKLSKDGVIRTDRLD